MRDRIFCMSAGVARRRVDGWALTGLASRTARRAAVVRAAFLAVFMDVPVVHRVCHPASRGDVPAAQRHDGSRSRLAFGPDVKVSIPRTIE
jgi:hypothetical protein